MVDVTGGMSAMAQGLLLLVLGGAIAAGGGYLYQDAKQATENAVEVDATIISSDVERELAENQNSVDEEYVYYPSVQYRYTYDGQTYTSRNICPGAGSGCDAAQNKESRSKVEEFVAQYPEDGTTTVHVLPTEPSNAYLVEASPGSTNAYLILVGLGGLVGLLGFGILASGTKTLLTG